MYGLHLEQPASVHLQQIVYPRLGVTLTAVRSVS